MLTRVEIDGFKSFEDFGLDVGPMGAFVGTNAVGKSNLFDALRFLRAIATQPLLPAVQQQRRGLPHELFSFGPDGKPRDTMRLTVEVLLAPTIVDGFNNTITLRHRRLRYEVELGWFEESGARGLEVRNESVKGIAAKDDHWQIAGRAPDRAFIGHRELPNRQFLSTETQADGVRTFRVAQDGHSGRPRQLAGTRATETVLSHHATSEFPHLYALRQELLGWRFLELDAVRMAEPASLYANPTLDADGANLAAVLHHLKVRTRSDDRPEGVLADIAAQLSLYLGGVRRVVVEPDQAEQRFRLTLEQQDGTRLSARLLSEGTLRLLGLFAVLHDDAFQGLLCMEEPENGVHPERLRRLLAELRDACARPLEAPDAASQSPVLRQILVNSHSPVVLAALRDRDHEVFFVDVVRRSQGAGWVRRTRVRPVDLHTQGRMVSSDVLACEGDVERYLHTVTGPG